MLIRKQNSIYSITEYIFIDDKAIDLTSFYKTSRFNHYYHFPFITQIIANDGIYLLCTHKDRPLIKNRSKAIISKIKGIFGWICG